MIPTPYRFEANLTDQEFQKIGRLALRWSHIEHMMGNCLKRLLRLSDEEAIVVIFPLSLESRMQQISKLSDITPMGPYSQQMFDELKPLIKAIQYIRNNVVHAIVIENEKDEPFFHLRSKGRNLTKAQLFGCEDITNYAAHVALAFRISLGEKGDDRGHNYKLPDRPTIPDFLPKDCRFPLRE